MTKVALALSTALICVALGSSAALAIPTPIIGTAIAPLAGPPGVDDAFQIFRNTTNQVGGFPITLSAEANCLDPASIGGCSFSLDTFNLFGGVTISPNALMENQIAVFYLPGTTTIDAIFALGCDGAIPNRNTSTGLCLSLHQPNFTILTPDPAHPFDLSLLSGVGVTIGFAGTELPGTTTAFDLTNFITVTGSAEGQTYTAQLVLNNVPEPMTMSLFGAGLVGAVAMRRRKALKA